MQSLPHTNGVVTGADVPATNDEISPFVLGQLDAFDGLLCVPEDYWVRHIDKVLYCLGYADIAGENDTTRWFTGTGDAIEDDYQWIREGC